MARSKRKSRSMKTEIQQANRDRRDRQDRAEAGRPETVRSGTALAALTRRAAVMADRRTKRAKTRASQSRKAIGESGGY